MLAGTILGPAFATLGLSERKKFALERELNCYDSPTWKNCRMPMPEVVPPTGPVQVSFLLV